MPAGICKLQTLRQYYRLPETGAHTALGDVRTVVDLMQKVLRPLVEKRISWGQTKYSIDSFQGDRQNTVFRSDPSRKDREREARLRLRRSRGASLRKGRISWGQTKYSIDSPNFFVLMAACVRRDGWRTSRGNRRFINPLFPALQSSPTAVQEPPAESKFLAV